MTVDVETGEIRVTSPARPGAGQKPVESPGIGLCGEVPMFTARLASLERDGIPDLALIETALARALKYNLDQRVEIMQTAVRARELSFASYSMLPNFVANSVYAGRDNHAASSSISVLSQRQSLEPSYSQDKNFVFGDLSLSWNILDFGLSYVRARQAADAVLIAEESRRRVVSRIIKDVRTAY